MKILICGADGMIGHGMFSCLRLRHDVKGTLHKGLEQYQTYSCFGKDNVYPNIDITNNDQMSEVIDTFMPTVVINATGIVKQRAGDYSKAKIIEVNALVPHRLADLCAQRGTTLIQFSTDCVFSGRRGDYCEEDRADADDLYGVTKHLGECEAQNCLTLRTSSIGLELAHCHGLIEWFLSQRGTIWGFTKAIYSGLTTLELARVVDFVIVNHSEMTGLWQVSSSPISKYELLNILKHKLGRTDIEIRPDDSVVCDRSLQGERFRRHTGYEVPTWPRMLDELSGAIRKRNAHGVSFDSSD